MIKNNRDQLKYLKSQKNIEVNNLLKIFTVEQANLYIDILNQFAYKKNHVFYDRVKYMKKVNVIKE